MISLIEPFEYAFFVRALWVAGVIGIVCGVLSCFITLKGWSLLGDALSHAVVPGVVIANLFAWPFALGAFIAGMLAALGIGLVRRISGLPGDAVIGVILTGFFALGMVLISLFPSMISLTTVLFGNLLGITAADALQMLIIALSVGAIVFLCWKDLLLYTFDEAQARMVGLNVRWLYSLMLMLVAAVSVAALQAVGAILVMSLMVTPGATAYLLTQRFAGMLWIAPLLGGGLAVAGVYISYFLDVSAGGCIVLLQGGAFLVALLLGGRRVRALSALDDAGIKAPYKPTGGQA
ncbi:Manganese transport system membrane protein MntB [Halomonadaceae bacterium LMG 33818]|uniref:metal ABC transporter permease n=1 Tax=Cernens ardua TaxID=3402176 RepID=UPI003EDC5E44